MSWFKRKIPLLGQVYFRGNLAPRAEEFGYLRELGFTVSPAKTAEDEQWALKLSHSSYADAVLACAKEATEPVPSEMMQFDARLLDEEKETIRLCRSSVRLRMDSPSGHILRDRKQFLRVGNAVCGSDGVVLLDAVGWTFWTAAALQDELSHDAALDVTGIFIFHAITDGEGEERRCPWAHTHGLSEVGKFDFDLIAPSQDALSGRTDFTRALAFAVVEDRMKLDGEAVEIVLGATPIRFVSVHKFMESASGKAVDEYREMVDERHKDRRGVACDPPARGLIARLLGRGGRLAPSRVASSDFPDGGLVSHSLSATDVMAERAAGTLTLMTQWRDEFAEFEPTCIAKLRFETANDGHEYPWFEVHSSKDGEIDATCLNDPYGIRGLKKGDRRRFPSEQIVDWNVMLPFATLNPAALAAGRRIRERLPELRKIMAEYRAAQAQGAKE